MVATIEKNTNSKQEPSLRKVYSFEEYLAFEERSPHKHEFYNGEIIRMAKAKAKHSQIAANLTGALKYALRPFLKNQSICVLLAFQLTFPKSTNTLIF